MAGPVGSIPPPATPVADASIWDASERTTQVHEFETQRAIHLPSPKDLLEDLRARAEEALFLANAEIARATAELERAREERDQAMAFAAEIQERAAADSKLLAGERDHAMALAAELRARNHRNFALLTTERDRAVAMLAEVEALRSRERAELEGERDEARAHAAMLEARYGAVWRKTTFEEAVEAVMFGRTRDGLETLRMLAALDPTNAEYQEWIRQAESFVAREA